MIVTGATRTEAIERARRSLDEFKVDGIATALTFHRAVVRDEAFAPSNPETPFSIPTRWIESEFVNEIPAYSGAGGDIAAAVATETLTLEVNGRRVEVVIPTGLSTTAPEVVAAKPARKVKKNKQAVAASGDAVVAPMQGTIVKVAVEIGQSVAAGDLVIVLEAMKMEQPLTAHKDGVIALINAEIGATVSSVATLLEITD